MPQLSTIHTCLWSPRVALTLNTTHVPGVAACCPNSQHRPRGRVVPQLSTIHTCHGSPRGTPTLNTTHVLRVGAWCPNSEHYERARGRCALPQLWTPHTCQESPLVDQTLNTIMRLMPVCWWVLPYLDRSSQGRQSVAGPGVDRSPGQYRHLLGEKYRLLKCSLSQRYNTPVDNLD